MMGNLDRLGAISELADLGEGLDLFYQAAGEVFTAIDKRVGLTSGERVRMEILRVGIQALLEKHQEVYFWSMTIKDVDELIALIAEHDLEFRLTGERQ